MGRRSLALTRDIGLDGDDVAPARHRYVSGCAIRSPSELTSVPAGKHTSESGLPASVWTALQPHKGPSETMANSGTMRSLQPELSSLFLLTRNPPATPGGR